MLVCVQKPGPRYLTVYVKSIVFRLVWGDVGGNTLLQSTKKKFMHFFILGAVRCNLPNLLLASPKPWYYSKTHIISLSVAMRKTRWVWPRNKFCALFFPQTLTYNVVVFRNLIENLWVSNNSFTTERKRRVTFGESLMKIWTPTVVTFKMGRRSVEWSVLRK